MVVRLGIEAPDDVEVWREEIYEKIQKPEDIEAIDLGGLTANGPLQLNAWTGRMRVIKN